MTALLDADTWRNVARGILLFVGALATAGGLSGSADAVLSENLLYVGGGALVVLAASLGASAIGRFAPGGLGGSGSPPAPNLQPATDPPADRGALPALELYQSESCPYCRKVRRYCTKTGISVVLHNPRTTGSPLTGGSVTNDARHSDLTAHGQDQIPLLVDHDRGVALYESDDIVAYLDAYYA